MSTPTLSSLDRFDADYPERLSDQLDWLQTHLRVPRSRILRLMGLRGAEVGRLQTRPWREIVKMHETQANRAEHLLTHYLSFFQYDAGKATDFANEFAGKPESARRLTDYLPALALAKTAEEQEEILVRAAHEEGASLLPAIAKLLTSPSGMDNGDPGKSRHPRPPRDLRRKAQ